MARDNDVDVKITDFGLAKRANKEGLKTFCGTPQYFAPEVLKRRNTVLGVGRYGKEADMWSVGETWRGNSVNTQTVTMDNLIQPKAPMFAFRNERVARTIPLFFVYLVCAVNKMMRVQLKSLLCLCSFPFEWEGYSRSFDVPIVEPGLTP